MTNASPQWEAGAHPRRLHNAVADTFAVAAGRTERPDPVGPITGGPAGNAVLTAWVGLALLVLSVGELITLLDVEGLINWHVAIGALLIPPALAKTGSTGWRILRYYAGDPAYRLAGPPPLPLRILGPLVVVTTLALLTTGVVLIALGPDHSEAPFVSAFGLQVGWLGMHQASFVAWAVAAGLHVLGRAVPAARLVGGRAGPGTGVPGSRLRAGLLMLAAAVAAMAAVLLVNADAAWH